MASNVVRDMETAYQSGELEELKSSILPFLKANREKLILFIREFQRVEGPCPLELLIKIFIIQLNMPFDMRQYMQKQSSAIRSEIQEENYCNNRQLQVAEWIRSKAEAHRSTSMFQQVFCFEKLKSSLLPIIEQEFNLSEFSIGPKDRDADT